MLGNLVKHEFHATSRIIPLFYLAVLAIAIPALIFNATNYTVMSLIFSSLLMLVGSALTYGTVIYLTIRFYKGVYGPEGYLAMTLPAGENTVLLSRGIVAAAWTLLSSVCFIVTFYYSLSTILYSSQEPAEEISMAMSVMSGGFMWFVAISTLIGSLALLAQAYLCVTIAHVKPFRKLGLGAAVLAYIVMYFAQSVVSMPLTLFAPPSLKYAPHAGWSLSGTSMFKSYGDMLWWYGNANNLADNGMSIGIAAVFLSVIMLIVCPIITARLMKKKINIR